MHDSDPKWQRMGHDIMHQTNNLIVALLLTPTPRLWRTTGVLHFGQHRGHTWVADCTIRAVMHRRVACLSLSLSLFQVFTSTNDNPLSLLDIIQQSKTEGLEAEGLVVSALWSVLLLGGF